jgi:hypothetical protein
MAVQWAEVEGFLEGKGAWEDARQTPLMGLEVMTLYESVSS